MTHHQTASIQKNSDSQLILSATAIPLRQGRDKIEVLLLQRNPALKTHGGSWVFPGGKADSNDIPDSIEHKEPGQLSDTDKMQVAPITACREAEEEAGLYLEHRSLKAISRWITPPSMRKRFDAFFYLSQPDSSEVRIDHGEIHDYQWISPVEALAAHAKSNLTLPPPTFLTLLQLSQYVDCAQAVEEMSREISVYRPHLLLTDKGFHSLYEDDAYYDSPSQEMIKPCHRLIMEHGRFRYINEGLDK